MMTDMREEKTSTAQIQTGLRALSELFGKEEQAIVLVVDQDERVLEYRVQPLADVVADLAVHGLGEESRNTP